MQQIKDEHIAEEETDYKQKYITALEEKLESSQLLMQVEAHSEIIALKGEIEMLKMVISQKNTSYNEDMSQVIAGVPATTPPQTPPRKRKRQSQRTSAPIPEFDDPNGRAWTDIVRTKYPLFLRSTNQTTQHVRSYLKNHNCPLIRVRATTNANGHPAKSFAVPEHLEEPFLQDFEDHFHGYLRRLGGDDQPPPPRRRLRRSVESESESSKNDGYASEDAIVEDDISDQPVLTRYSTLVAKVMPSVSTLPPKARLAIKRGVKQFLEIEMGEGVEDCYMQINDGGEEKKTLGIPEYLVSSFMLWVRRELGRCFPDIPMVEAAI